MGLFTDFVEGFANGFLSGTADGTRSGGQLPTISSLCSQLGWSIDERVGSDGYVLHFKDPLLGIRKLLITVGSGGRLVMFMALSASDLTPERVPTEILGYLLRRNYELVLGAWRMSVDNTVTFSVAHGMLMSSLNPGVFKAMCEMICKEAYEFDAKLRQAGLV
jgi:hypothetical protein